MRSLCPLCLLLVLVGSSLSAMAQRPGGGGRPSGPPRATPTIPSSVANVPTDMTRKYAEDEEKVAFRSETILVQVPVVINDKAGRHVHNLTKDDFRIFENGKEQKIASFEEVTATRAPVAVAARPGIFTNLVPDRDKPRAITVIALDTVNTPFLDQSYARRELVKYLANNMDTGQTLALVLISSKGLKVVSGLTSSAESLQQLLKKASGELSGMQTVDSEAELAAFTGDTSNLFSPTPTAFAEQAVNQFITQGDIDYAQFKQEAAIETTMQAFLGIAWSLSGVHGRKTLLWATGGFPFTLDSPSAVPGGNLSLLYERAMKALSDAEVSIYPVDAQGLVYTGPGANSGRTPKGAAMQQMANRAWLLNSKQDTLKDFAEMTGGRAFYNTNDLAGAFQRATDDSSSYYMMGYYLDTKNNKPGWRQLKVKLEKKDMEIRARRGFFVTNATMNPEASRVNDMNFAMAAPFDATGIPIEMQWGAVKEIPGNKEKKQVAFTLHLIGTDISIEGANNAINLAVTAVATQPTGRKEGPAPVVANLAQAIKGSLKPENVATLRAHGLSYPGALELAPGKYSVRFVIRDNLSGRLGSVSAPVTVN
jgi:VWFA-related protein